MKMNVFSEVGRISKNLAGSVYPRCYCSYGTSNLFKLALRPVILIYFILSFQLFTLGVHPSTLEVRSRNAEQYRFRGWEHLSHSLLLQGVVTVGDGATLILDNDGCAGKEQFSE